ncbi:hypothetical protein ACCO45_012640 [Purpureocillium lilacinum]|uniref:Uncharacterized protein n=1 Tax=Purpureocillium lilacinum TaxID=33203 RepID=A0ACC4DA49_PURLI
MALFVEKYVNVGGESVFGRISRYFGAIATNERERPRNARLASAFDDVDSEGNDEYRDRIVRYVESAFSEVPLCRAKSGASGNE